MLPLTVISTAISGITGYFSKKQDGKAAVKSASAKLAQSKQDGYQSITLTDAEWESLAVQTQQESWKDEYVTIIITAPILMILLGSLSASLGFDHGPLVLQGALDGIVALKALGMDYGFLVNSVVLAAIGLKVWRA